MIAQRAYVLVFLVLLAACAPSERPSVFEALVQAESSLVAAQDTLHTALQLGTVDVSSQEYAHAYAGLERANLLLDQAWAAYRAGELQQADQLRQFSLDAYMAVRPMLERLAGGVQ